MRLIFSCALMFGITVASRAELRFVGVLEIGRVTYYAVGDNGPAKFFQLGERYEGWRLIAYDQRGALSLSKDDQLKVLWLPRSRVRDANPLVRAHTLAANGDNAVAYMIAWLGEIAAMKKEVVNSLTNPNREDVLRLEAKLAKLHDWETMAKERTIILTLASEAEP